MPDIPPVPEEYIELALATAKDKVGPIQSPTTAIQNTINNRVLTRDGRQFVSRNSPRFGLEEYMGNWVNANISKEWCQIGVATSIVNKEMGDPADYTHGPHTDVTRQYCLLYLIEQGNPDQDTVFWQEPGHGVHRKRNHLPLNLGNLIRLDSIRIPMRTWVYFDVSILHSIENIHGSRIAIHVGFDCEPFNVFVKD
jgi:hypothetical protein